MEPNVGHQESKKNYNYLLFMLFLILFSASIPTITLMPGYLYSALRGTINGETSIVRWCL